MKSLVKRLMRRARLVVVTSEHAAVRYIEQPPEGAFDEILLRLFPNLQGLNFIQIGANDGVRADPLFRYVTPCGWSGVLVEPIPSYFNSLCAHYAGNARLGFINAAIDAEPGERLLYHCSAAADIPDWARGVVSFDRSHVQQILGTVCPSPDIIVEERVRTTTWDEVLRLFGPRHCDILVTDVEGFDLTLLRLADLGRLRPTLIQFEHGAVPIADRLAFYGELIGLGYELATSDIDTVAYRTDGARRTGSKFG